MTRRVNGLTEDPPARRAGRSHDWQSRWSHEAGRKPLRVVPCSWQATSKARAKRSGLIVIPTGGGKTSTMVRWLILQMGQHPELRVLWLADQRELVEQAAGEFVRCGSQLPVGCERILRVVRSGGSSASSLVDSKLDVVCSTRQSLIGRKFDAPAKKRLQRYLSDRPCVVVIDEAHHAVSPTYRELLAEIWKAKRLPLLVGMTATPFPSGLGMTAQLRDTFPTSIVSVQTRDLILNGDLAQPITHSFNTAELVVLTDTERQRISRHDLPDSVLKRLDTARRNELAVDTWIRSRERWGKTLVFAGNIDHADHLREAFRRRGVAAEAVHSRAEGEVGDELRRFREAPGGVLISVGMLLEGVDIPSARTAFLCRPTSSRLVMQQMIGRVLRGPRAGGDPFAHIVDLRDRWEEGLDILRPVDLPDVPVELAPDEDGAPEFGRRLPPVLAEDGQTPIGEDLLAAIEAGMAERVRVWAQTATLTPTRLVGYYDLTSLRIPIFEHTRRSWMLMGSEQARWLPSSAGVMSYFEDVAPPEPLERDARAFLDYCRSQLATPPFVELVAGVDVGAVARELVDLPPMTESQRLAWLRSRYESTLARSQYPSLQAYDEAVRSQTLILLGATRTG